MKTLAQLTKKLIALEAKVAEQAKKITEIEARLGSPRPVHKKLDGFGPDGKGSARPLTDFVPP